VQGSGSAGPTQALYSTPNQARPPTQPHVGTNPHVGGHFQMVNAQGQMIAGGATDPGQAGVGLFFQQKKGHDNVVFVKTIVKGGSAEKDGMVKVGDVLRKVEGKVGALV